MKVAGMGIQRCYPWIVYPFHLYLCIIDSLKILFPCEKSGCYSLGHLCNSTSVTVAWFNVQVPLMYLGLMFNFEFKYFLWILLNQVIIATCKGTLKFCIMKYHAKKDFWWIYGIFPKGLNPFKIQGTFKLEIVPKFMAWYPAGIWNLANENICSIWSNLPLCKSWKFLDSSMYPFHILQFGISLIFG
jgi:hypothetical protein